MNCFVTIQVNTPTTTARGERVDSWATFAEAYAEIEPITGREFYAAQQVNSEITTKITIRYIAGIGSKLHRIIYGSSVYNILSAMNLDMRNRKIVLMCKEVS